MTSSHLSAAPATLIPPSAITYDDVVVLTAWMAREGYSADDLACAVEKPHHYRDEIARANAAARTPAR